jgi:hypothetical protein
MKDAADVVPDVPPTAEMVEEGGDRGREDRDIRVVMLALIAGSRLDGPAADHPPWVREAGELDGHLRRRRRFPFALQGKNLVFFGLVFGSPSQGHAAILRRHVPRRYAIMVVVRRAGGDKSRQWSVLTANSNRPTPTVPVAATSRSALRKLDVGPVDEPFPDEALIQ